MVTYKLMFFTSSSIDLEQAKVNNFESIYIFCVDIYIIIKKKGTDKAIILLKLYIFNHFFRFLNYVF
jgi:hypothetical protein